MWAEDFLVVVVVSGRSVTTTSQDVGCGFGISGVINSRLGLVIIPIGLFRFGSSSLCCVYVDYYFFFLMLGSVMLGGILFCLDCFFVRNIVFGCLEASIDVSVWVGLLRCSVNFVQGFGGIVFCCFVELGLGFGSGVLIGESAGSLSCSIGVRAEAV